jgi:hypothetical protein
MRACMNFSSAAVTFQLLGCGGARPSLPHHFSREARLAQSAGRGNNGRQPAIALSLFGGDAAGGAGQLLCTRCFCFFAISGRPLISPSIQWRPASLRTTSLPREAALVVRGLRGFVESGVQLRASHTRCVCQLSNIPSTSPTRGRDRANELPQFGGPLSGQERSCSGHQRPDPDLTRSAWAASISRSAAVCERRKRHTPEPSGVLRHRQKRLL